MLFTIVSAKTPPRAAVVLLDSGVARDVFDVSRDGERFLFHSVPSATPSSGPSVELVLIQNWVDELKRLVPREP